MSQLLDEQAARRLNHLHHKSSFENPVISNVTASPAFSERPHSSERPLVDLSVIVPSRNEAGNIQVLLLRLQKALRDIPFEVLFVDDSDDETPALIADMADQLCAPVLLLHRPPNQRYGGLGGAVVHGLRGARGRWVCVMDADLQHPPEIVPELLDRAQRGDLDLVIASRYCASGTVGSFSWARESFSRGSTLAAHAAFPAKLRGVTDPMSGFFLVRQNAIDPERLRPLGFKILLEIIGRSPRLRIAEVPFHFGERHAGRSKASAKEGMRYVRQLASLRLNDEAHRFIKFVLVGASGLVVNSLLLAFTAGVINLFYLFAAVLATQGSTAWNFALSERFVFPSGRMRSSRRRRCLLFFVMNNTALAVRGPIMFTLTSALGMHYLWSNLVSMIALLLLRFSTADRWIWGTAPPSEADSTYSVTAPTVPAVEGA